MEGSFGPAQTGTPMREALFFVLMGALTIVSVVNARLGILGYVWFSLARPDMLAFVAGRYPYGEILAGAILIGSARRLVPMVLNLFGSPFPLFFVIFTAWFTISARLAWNHDAAMDMLNQFLRISSLVFLIPMLIDTPHHLRLLFLTTAVSLGFVGVYFGFTAMAHGGLYIYQGVGGSISDNNMMAIALVMAIPFCWFGMQMVKPFWFKLMLGSMVFGCVATIVMTLSRGGFIGMVVVLLLLTLRSRHRIILLVAVPILLVPPVLLMKDKVTARLSTLSDVQEENSAWSRVEQAQMAFKLIRHYWWAGVGPGDDNYLDAVERETGDRPTTIVHSTPLQVLIHLGIPGFILYVGLFGSCLVSVLRSARRNRLAKTGLDIYGATLAIALLGFFTAAFVHPRMTWDFSYMIVMYTASLRLAEKHMAAKATAVEPAAKVLQPAGMPPRAVGPAFGNVPGGANINRWNPGPAGRLNG